MDRNSNDRERDEYGRFTSDAADGAAARTASGIVLAGS